MRFHLLLKPFLTFFPIQILTVLMLLRNVFATLRDYITKVNRLIELGLPVVALNERFNFDSTILQVVVSEKIVKEVLRERGFLLSLPFEKVTEFVRSAFFLV